MTRDEARRHVERFAADIVAVCRAVQEVPEIVVADVDAEALRLLLSPPTCATWQPIETAPEGTDVIVFFPDANEEYQWMICHRLEGDWYEQNADTSPDPIDDVEPTHWMPLPEPPRAEQGGE